MSDNIKVVVKVRPLISREIEDKLSYQWRVQDNTLHQLDHNGRDAGVAYTFDKVYDTNTKTSDVYNDIAKPIVEAATAGFNGTIFAYGQTSSGKTYTMTGTEDAPGIIPLAIFNLFEIIKTIPNRDFLVRVSYLEIYNEMLVDLLNIEKKNIKVQETLQGVKVDATEKVTSSPEEVLDVMKEGKANRQTAATNMNEESSRSHSIFQITIESREHIEGEEEGGCVNVSQLNLVDLAGSERAGQTGATGIRFKEGTHINKSLSVLALVIKQLSDDPNKHANYRDSKLTRILQNSLGGNAKTSIICAVTPAAVEETISTLQFANRAKSIKNKPAVNAVATDATMIQQLTKQLSHLKTELENKKSVEKNNYALQKQIAALQKLILNGFGHRSSAEMLNPRRKLVQPRRVTISTLHSIEEDPVPSVPKFCTPSLKYNPLVLPGAPDFVPIQGALSLPTLPEEPPRLATPPPRDKKVNFDNEIIEIDSDDDCTGEPQTCPTSPYHKCYESSKTPPCILRKNVKRAEKSLKEIVELTEREKIFTPSVVELMEKLEQNAAVIAQLEDEVTKLNILSKEKDTEMEKLKCKIIKAEEEFKTISMDKVKLETICKEYDTRLTDSEVCYETLKNKAKRREEELLSLLEEQAPKKPSEKIGNILTNSENIDQPIIMKSNNELSKISDLQAQLALKDKTIKELESIISTHEERVISLESICKEYQNDLESYKEKLSCVEKQVQDHKNTIESLNKVIETQNQNKETINSDIESYKQLIQELQIKLRKMEDIDINDIDLETLIAKEETFIANNDNIRNIIHGFKINLQAKYQEIQTLKESAENRDSATLGEEIRALKDQANDYLNTINKMSFEQSNWLKSEEQLNVQIRNLEEAKNNLENENVALSNQIKETKAANEQLSNDLLKKEQDFTTAQENYLKEIQDKCNKVHILEMENKSKDETVASLNKAHEESNEHYIKAKSALSKVQSIMTVLTGNVQTVPDIVDNFVLLFNTLVDELGNLETIASTIVSQKKELFDLIKQCENEYASIENQIDNIIESIDIANLDQFNITLQDEPKESKIDNREQDNDMENQKISQEKLSAYKKLKCRIDKLITVLGKSQNAYQEKIESKDKEIASIKKRLSNYEKDQEEKANELLQAKQEKEEQAKLKHQLLMNIFNKTLDLTMNFNIENNISCNLGNEEDNVYEEILLTLDKIANHMTVMNHKNENDNLEEVLLEAKKQIRELTEQNLKFISDISHLEAKNVNLYEELRKIRQENKYLAEDLEKSGKVLELLRAELDDKLTEMDNIQDKARQWKDQFSTLDFLMKEQVHAMRLENANFKSRYSGSINKINDFYYSESDSNTDSSNYQPSFCTDAPIELKSPQSLLTLCCNRIIDVMQSNENLSQNHTELSSNTNVCETEDHHHLACQCNKFEFELKEKEEENLRLQTIIEQLRSRNQDLTKEHEEVQNEVKSLLDITYELQKKVLNHRTNLSTLTATTYAENKSLSSQIKCLQHLHNRFHTVCQRDIPAFKQQLQELLTLLKNENLISNDNIKRFSLPNALDVTEIPINFKNESTLDGDLLMLDTNVTITTTGDTTLVGHDETCFDVTRVCVYNEVACQTVDLPSVTESILLNPQMTIIPNENTEALRTLEELKKENNKLREMVDDYLVKKETRNSLVNAQTSPIKTEKDSGDHFLETLNYDDLLNTQENHLKEIEMLSQKVLCLESEKSDILDKYNNLVLETPSTESLVKKITILQKEFNSKVTELDSVKSLLNKNIKEMAALQDENDNLSTQVIEIISELDELKKEHDILKIHNSQLSDNHSHLQKEKVKVVDENMKFTACSKCEAKDKLINSLQEKVTSESRIRLSRSLSDSERSSSYNTICTLQSELHAGKEDCNKLKEEVTTIKNHLDRSSLSIGQEMDLDESIGEPNIFTYTKDLDSIEPKCNMPDIPEEHSLDIYALDKADCINYYIEMTATDKKDFSRDIKIIDVMKLLYNNVMTKHTNEVENLVNKIRDFEDTKVQLQSQIEAITKEYSSKMKELQQNACDIETVKCMFSQIKENISKIEVDSVDNNDPIKSFKDSVLKPLDTKFGLNSTIAFDSVLQNVANNFRNILDEKSSQCTKLEESIKSIQDHFSTISNDLSHLKSQLTEKENKFNLLKKQKERIQEISNAVTLDIVKKEKELIEIVNEGCRKLSQHNILEQGDIDRLSPAYKNIDTIFDLVIEYFNNEHILMKRQKVSTTQEVTNLKTIIESKNVELKSLTECLKGKENDLTTQANLFKDLNQIYEKKVQENEMNLNVIDKMHEEINKLKGSLSSKDITIQTLESNVIGKNETKCLEDKINELLLSKENLEAEIYNLKSINGEIIKERDNYAKQLEESASVIKEKKMELESLNSDIIVLKESVKENVNIMENMKQEMKSLFEQNTQLKEQLQEKMKDCSRLEMNIKTHEKTAEIQSRMIMRLQKQKEDESEKDKQIEELKKTCEALQSECESLHHDIKNTKEELHVLQNAKQKLETQISELQEAHKPRLSMEADARRRRQSLHDSKRMFAEDKSDLEDHHKMESLFGSRPKNDDFFMEVDGVESNGSTPLRLSKGRDSSQYKNDQSDKDDDPPSRPSSVLATRRRRQSVHDLHRSVLSQTPSPHDTPRNIRDVHDIEKPNSHQSDSEVVELKKQLASCQEELEDLKEKYKELDDECETCAEYLRERDEQCLRLKKDKRALEQAVAELQAKLQNPGMNNSGRRVSFSDAAINTDEDWTNLHAVVVDRMSFDAEVDKNKKLVKVVEELRFKKQELRTAVAKMQKALEKKALHDNRDKELEATRSELQACKEELDELKERYKELDEECETCAEYLRERDEQCRKLKEAKTALEIKLKEYEDDASIITLSVRKKRQTLHDQNRLSTTSELVDASTETNEDFLSYQVEKDTPQRTPDDAQSKEVKRLRIMIDRLSAQKAALEQRLLGAPLYVATGSAIVQNQQLTDVMKENQKLKKINAKLINICKKRGKTLSESNRENQDPTENC